MIDASDQSLIDGVLDGQRRALAKTITLIESTRDDHQLRAGEVLQTGDIKLMPVSNRALALQAVRDPALIVGKALRSTLPAGSLLRESQLRLPLVIKTNQPVRVLVQGSGFNWVAPDHFRVVFLPNSDDLTEAIGRIARFLENYRKQHGTA